MNEVMVLYILSRFDTTIYGVMKYIGEMFFAFSRTSSGTINPTIKKLEKEGYVKISTNMSSGGLESKICTITLSGRKYLQELLMSFDISNPSLILNHAKIAICCCDVLSSENKTEFFENLKNQILLYKAKIEAGLKNPQTILEENVIKMSKMQVASAEHLIREIEELCKL